MVKNVSNLNIWSDTSSCSTKSLGPITPDSGILIHIEVINETHIYYEELKHIQLQLTSACYQKYIVILLQIGNTDSTRSLHRTNYWGQNVRSNIANVVHGPHHCVVVRLRTYSLRTVLSVPHTGHCQMNICSVVNAI